MEWSHADANLTWLLLAWAGVAIYISARAAVDALGALAPFVPSRPGRLAWALWMPIAVLAIGAAATGRGAIALAAVLASSVACMTLAAGITAFLQPASAIFSESHSNDPNQNRAAPRPTILTMLLPVALLLFLAGFRGQLTLLHALILAVEGVVVWLIAVDRPAARSEVKAAGLRLTGLRILQLLVAIALAGAGAWAAVRGASAAASAGGIITSPATVATLMVGPLLVLPILGASVDLVGRGAAETALVTQGGVLLLNLCLLLPIVIVETRVVPLLPRMTPVAVVAQQSSQASTAPAGSTAAGSLAATRAIPATRPASQPTTAPEPANDSAFAPPAPPPLPFALANWRVDGVALVVLGLFFLPIGLGRWKLSRASAGALIVGYLAYLAMTIVMALSVL